MFSVLRLARMRFAAASGGAVDPRFYKLFKGEGEPPEVAAATRNVINLYEMPTLFYAGTAFAFAAGAGGTALVALGWAYVALRGLHSAVHVTTHPGRGRRRRSGARWDGL